MTTAIMGRAANLVLGSITLIKPPGDQYWYIQNQSALVGIQLTTPGKVGGPILSPATIAGQAGDWLDTNKYPFLMGVDQITLTATTGADPTAQFACWSSPNTPNQTQKIAI